MLAINQMGFIQSFAKWQSISIPPLLTQKSGDRSRPSLIRFLFPLPPVSFSSIAIENYSIDFWHRFVSKGGFESKDDPGRQGTSSQRSGL